MLRRRRGGLRPSPPARWPPMTRRCLERHPGGRRARARLRRRRPSARSCSAKTPGTSGLRRRRAAGVGDACQAVAGLASGDARHRPPDALPVEVDLRVRRVGVSETQPPSEGRGEERRAHALALRTRPFTAPSGVPLGERGAHSHASDAAKIPASSAPAPSEATSTSKPDSSPRRASGARTDSAS